MAIMWVTSHNGGCEHPSVDSEVVDWLSTKFFAESLTIALIGATLIFLSCIHSAKSNETQKHTHTHTQITNFELS